MVLKVKAKAQLMKVGKYANTCRCGKSKRKVEEWGSQIPQITHILNRGLKEKASCRLSAKGFVCFHLAKRIALRVGFIQLRRSSLPCSYEHRSCSGA